MEWQELNELDLTIKRDLNRNAYGYGSCYVEELDLFGDDQKKSKTQTKRESNYTP